MAWPTLQDYTEALQHPAGHLNDVELRQALPETDNFGIPRGIPGGFAIVFKMQAGNKTIALRCFRREVVDQQQRYEAISEHLKNVRLPYTVGFEYQREGIRIKGVWYPIIKMEWISGQSLGAYIEKNLNNPTVLLELATGWMTMVESLRQASVAHGDLQDGNVLVAGTALKLIDYDGMYIPKLAGLTSNETGHRNYQHPNRTALDFGLYIDNFSSWVIYVSLIALAIDPSLWKKLNGGDDCLLFRQADFDPLKQSSARITLSKHADTRLQNLAALFETLLYLQPMQIPDLADSKVRAAVPSSALSAGGASSTIHGSTNPQTLGASWLLDHIPNPANQGGNSTRQPPQTQTTASGSSWILDFISPSVSQKTFSFPTRTPRLALTSLLSLMAVIPVLHSFYGDLIGEAILTLIVYFASLHFYHGDPVVAELEALYSQQHDQRKAITDAEIEMERHATIMRGLQEDEKKALNSLSQERVSFQKKENHETSRISSSLKSKIDTINSKLAELDRPLQKLQADYQAQVVRLNKQIADCNQAQVNELTTALAALQEQFVRNYLININISQSSIYQIGPANKRKLYQAGCYTAAAWYYDKSRYQYSIDYNRRFYFQNWIDGLVKTAQAKMPRALDQATHSSITAKFSAQRSHLEQQLTTEKQTFDRDALRMNSQAAAARSSLAAEKGWAQNQYQKDLQDNTLRFEQEYRRIDQRGVGIKSDFAKQYLEQNRVIDEVRVRLHDRNWETAKLKKEADAYKNLTYGHFILYLLGWRK